MEGGSERYKHLFSALTRLDDRQASDEVCASPLICPSVQRALRA